MMGVSYVVQKLRAVGEVSNVHSLEDGILLIERHKHPAFRARIVDIPRIDGPTANTLINENPDLQVIVNPGARRHVLEEGRAQGEARGVGIYGYRDFMAAVGNAPTAELHFYKSSWRNWARTVLEGHRRVTNVYAECEDVFVAERAGMTPVRVVPCNEYTLGVATVKRVLRDHPNIDAVLLANQYHSVSSTAAVEAREGGIAAYTLAQMNRALHRDGEDFKNVE